jgi:hypothetical protein
MIAFSFLQFFPENYWSVWPITWLITESGISLISQSVIFHSIFILIETCHIDIFSTCSHVLMNDNYCSNSEEIAQFPLQETVEDESWYPSEGIEQGEITPAGSSQMQGILGNRREYRDRAKKPQFSKQSGDVMPSKEKTDVSRKCKLKGRSQDVSDRWESDSSNEESDISSEEVRQPRSEYKVDTEDDNNVGNFNDFVKCECEVGIWGPYGNEVCNSHRKDNRHGNKKQDLMWKNPLPKPPRNVGKITPKSCMPQVSDNRAEAQFEWVEKKRQTENWEEQDHNLLQPGDDAHKDRKEILSRTYLPEVSDNRAGVQFEWVEKKHQTENWEEQDHNLLQPGDDAYKDRKEILSRTYLPEASDRRTQVQVDQSEKFVHTEIRKGDQDRNLLVRLPGPHTNERESMSKGYTPESSDSRAQVQVDWNLQKSVADIWKVHSNCVPESLDMGKGIPQEATRGQEDRDSRNRNCISRNLLRCSDEKLMTDKNDEWNGNKRLRDIWIDSVSQDADIGRTEEASGFVGEERPSKPIKRTIDHFLGKKSEDSGIHYDSKVRNCLNKCINEIESSADINHNNLQVPAERVFNCNPVSIQNSPENVRMLSAPCIHDALMHKTHNPRVSSRSTSQVHHAANSFSPPMTSTAGCFRSGDSLPTVIGISNQPHVQHVPNHPLESCSQPLPVPNVQELFEAFVQEQLRRLMSTNRMVQMAVENSTGLPNINPACLQNPQSDLKLQAQQINSLPGSATPINLHRRLPTKYSDLLLQSNDTSLNRSLAALLNTSLLRENQVKAPKNIPVQSDVSSSCNRIGNTVQVPNSDMHCSSTVWPGASVFQLNQASQTNYPNMYMNSAGSMPYPKYPSWISPLGISPNHMRPQKYQSSQPCQPTVGSMQNMQYVSPDVYSLPPGAKPADEFTSSRMVIGKGRGRLRP